MKKHFEIFFFILILLQTAIYAKEEKKDPFSQIKFIPEISLIADLSYNNSNIDSHQFEELHMPGFFSGGHQHSHQHPGTKSFNLNYGELVLKSSVDKYFDLVSIFHLSEDEFEIEELYTDTRFLPFGLNLRIGKFLSDFGRLNSQHAHFQDFYDRPVIHQAIFGEHGLLEKGARLSIVLPTNFFMEAGVEVLEGGNSNSFGTEGFEFVDHHHEAAVEVEDRDYPNLLVYYTKASVDIGDLVILGGVSFADGKIRLNSLNDEHSPQAIEGNSKIIGFDLTLRYSLDSYRYISLQTEYLHRKISGKSYKPHEDHHHMEEEHHMEEDEHNHTIPEVESFRLLKKQGGFYTQLIFKFHKQWRFGIRWDKVTRNIKELDSERMILPKNLYRWSCMLDFSPTEFSRLRVQYNINRHNYIDDLKKNFNSLIVQLQFAIGAHGAHKF